MFPFSSLRPTSFKFPQKKVQVAAKQWSPVHRTESVYVERTETWKQNTPTTVYKYFNSQMADCEFFSLYVSFNNYWLSQSCVHGAFIYCNLAHCCWYAEYNAYVLLMVSRWTELLHVITSKSVFSCLEPKINLYFSWFHVALSQFPNTYLSVMLVVLFIAKKIICQINSWI